jgi:hypothetical protein
VPRQGAKSPASAAATILLVAGLVLAAVAILRLGDVLGGDDFTDGGGTLTWMLALFTALAAFFARSARSAACLLIAALAAVALVLEAVNWVFDTENIDTFRALLAVSFAVLFLAGLAVSGRARTILVGAAGVTVIVGGYLSSGFFILGSGSSGLGWGWELIMLVQGVALLAYAARRLEPGPAYFAFFVLVFFATSAALGGDGAESGVVYEGDEPETEGASLVGWPLALGIGTVLAMLWGAFRDPRRRA